MSHLTHREKKLEPRISHPAAELITQIDTSAWSAIPTRQLRQPRDHLKNNRIKCYHHAFTDRQ